MSRKNTLAADIKRLRPTTNIVSSAASEHYAGELKDYNISEECQHDGEHRYFDEERHQGGCYRRQNEVFSRKCNLLDEPAVPSTLPKSRRRRTCSSTEESRRG